MQINLIAIGTKMPKWIEEGYHTYSKRMPHECRLHLIEVPTGKRDKHADITRVLHKEGEQMLQAISPKHHVIALDVKGKSYSTEQLAEELKKWLQAGNDVSLLVGGPEGLAPDCLEKATSKWSLSPLTFPHPLVRVIVAEQLYRAWTLVSHHPYHRK